MYASCIEIKIVDGPFGVANRISIIPFLQNVLSANAEGREQSFSFGIGRNSDLNIHGTSCASITDELSLVSTRTELSGWDFLVKQVNAKLIGTIDASGSVRRDILEQYL